MPLEGPQRAAKPKSGFYINRYEKPRRKGNIKKNSAPICPFCGVSSVLRPASYVYSGWTEGETKLLYVCANYPNCDTYVGVHDSLEPKGTLANAELRAIRMETHQAFDVPWKLGIVSRSQLYRMLQLRLQIKENEAHIGFLSKKQCAVATELAAQVVSNYRKFTDG